MSTRPVPTRLNAQQWRARVKQHRDHVLEWTSPCRDRRARGEKHPVIDFLFVYYPFSLGRLEQWHPGLGLRLETDHLPVPAELQGKHYRQEAHSIALSPDSLSEKERFRLRHIHNLLQLTQQRTPNFSCFGMHEWAMVYQGDRSEQGGDIRHRESAPLRLSQQEIDQTVENRPLCCSHFDAIRFFAPAALPMNKLNPTLDQRHEFEQPGCLHSNMDLYKWASKSMPWVGSDLLWRCFRLALKARELDMRASAYDLEQYHLSPVPVETPEGRALYEKLQRSISEQARPLRQELINTLSHLLAPPQNPDHQLHTLSAPVQSSPSP